MPRRISYGAVVRTAVAVAVIALASCAQQPQRDQLDRIQADLSATRAEVAQLSEQIERLDKLIRPPAPPRATVGIAGSPTLGNHAAKVAIVEFSDFQCPFCRRFHSETYPTLKERYIDTGKVMLVYRDLPLDFHPASKGAAVAARCAGAQGHFWDMADALFDGQERLGAAYYHELAGRLGFDAAAFKSCLEDASVVNGIARDVVDAAALGVEGTPTFFIGRVDGDKVVDAEGIYGAQPYAVMAQVIDSVLKASLKN